MKLAENGEVRIEFRTVGTEDLKQALREATENLRNFKSSATTTEGALKEYRERLREVTTAKRDLKRAIEINNQAFFGTVRVMQDVGSVVRTVMNMFNQYNVMQIRIQQAQQRVNEATKEVAKAQKEYEKILKQTWETSEEYKRQTEQLLRAQERLADATEDARRAEQEFNRVKERASIEVTERLAKLEERVNREREKLLRINDDVEEAALRVERAKLNLSRAEERLNEVLQKSKSTQLDILDAQLDVKEATMELKRAQEEYAKKLEEQKNLPQALAELERKAAEERKRIQDEYAEKVEEAERKVREAQAATLKAQEEYNKKLQEFQEARMKWEEDHAEAVEKAAERVEKAQNNLAEAINNLKTAQEQANTQMIMFATVGAIQTGVAIVNLVKDIAVLTGSLGGFSTMVSSFGSSIAGAGATITEVLSSSAIAAVGAVGAIIAALFAVKIFLLDPWLDAWKKSFGIPKELMDKFSYDLTGWSKSTIDRLREVYDFLIGVWNALTSFFKVEGGGGMKQPVAIPSGPPVGIPHYQQGGYVPRAGLYMLHPGEYVLPADVWRSMREFLSVTRVSRIEEVGVPREPARVVNINAPLINVEGAMDEKLARKIQESILFELRRIVRS